VRGYFVVHPDESSSVILDASQRNKWGDPLPKVVHTWNRETQARWPATKEHINGVFAKLAEVDNGKVLTVREGKYLDHPTGGCRMGDDPAKSVCDSFGRAHDHENLFVVGAPTLPAAGCTNGTLTFVALTLRSAPEIANHLPAGQAALDGMDCELGADPRFAAPGRGV
jgi:quinoprotein glucose dehydrogenase